MIIKSLILASIIFDLLGFGGLAKRYDDSIVRNEYNPSHTVIASSINSTLPDIPIRPKVKPDAPVPAIFAKNYILVDSDSGKILAKQAHKDRVPIASTTKIMSAVVVLENYELDEIITISPEAAYQIGATANLRVGERLTVESLLKAMLIKSANGAAYALAEHMNGDELSMEDGRSVADLDMTGKSINTEISDTDSEEGNISFSQSGNTTKRKKISKFISVMNEKARNLGMVDTEYHDPAGLDTTGYSSAYDLYLVTKYALSMPKFAEIVKTNHDVIKNVDGTIWHDLKNSNRLVGEYNYLGAIGVKTGYMPEAGHVLVSAATRDSHTLIGVVINTYADTAPASADESKKLLDWGFNYTQW